MKHLEVQGYCLSELAMRHKQRDPSSLRSNQDIASSDTSGQLGGVTGIPGQPVQAPAQTQSRGGVTGGLLRSALGSLQGFSAQRARGVPVP